MVDRVVLHLVAHLHGVVQRLGNVVEQSVHLCRGLHPLLLRVEHALRIIEILRCAKADKTVVSLGVLLIYEVHVVCTYELDAELLRHLNEVLVDHLLYLPGLVVGVLHGCLMHLQLEVVVVAKEVLIPQCRLLRLFELLLADKAWNLTTDTCRAAHDTLVVLLQLNTVGTWTSVETLGVTLRYYLNEVLVTLKVLCK